MASTIRAHAISSLKRSSLLNQKTISFHQFFPSSLSAVRHNSTRPETSQAACMYDIGTRPIFEDYHDQFRESCRKFFVNEIAPNHEKYEKQGRVDKEAWVKAGEQGLLGVNIDDSVGGIGGDFLSAAIVCEEQAYVNCTGPGFGLHSDIVMPYLAKYGTKEQQEKFLPRMTAGSCIGALAMSEPGAGSDVQGFRTSAKKDGDDYILNGSKVFITNGINADLVVVVARTDPNAKSQAHGTSLFLVEEGMEGFKKGRQLKKVGLTAQDTAELFFEDVRLPKTALLGEENKGFYYLMGELPRERLLIAIIAAASCEWVFEETKKYVIERKAFGKRLVDLQTIQHKLAEMKTEICIGRTFVDHCIKMQNDGRLDSVTASMAKYWLSDLQNKVASECLQLHGGWGYMWEYPVAKAFVDARVQPIYGGANEIMKELIARTCMK